MFVDKKTTTFTSDRCSGLTLTWVHPSHPSPMVITLVRRLTEITGNLRLPPPFSGAQTFPSPAGNGVSHQRKHYQNRGKRRTGIPWLMAQKKLGLCATHRPSGAWRVWGQGCTLCWLYPPPPPGGGFAFLVEGLAGASRFLGTHFPLGMSLVKYNLFPKLCPIPHTPRALFTQTSVSEFRSLSSSVTFVRSQGETWLCYQVPFQRK